MRERGSRNESIFMIETDRLVSGKPAAAPDEASIEQRLRPARLVDYVGQKPVREQMEIFISAARQRSEALDHVLLFGPPGLGKTTLAHIIANEMGATLRQTSGPALEDYQIDILIGEGPAARSIKLDLPPFTLIGATTRAGLLTSPLRDRFGIVQRLEFYNAEDLTRIVRRSAGILGVEAEEEGISAIARRARGTPRIANRLLRRARDFAEVKGTGVLTGRIAED